MAAPPVVLIIAGPQDLHARSVCRELESLGIARPCTVDTLRWPGEGSISLRPGARLDESVLRLPGVGHDLRPADIAAVWWRRSTGFGCADEVTDPRAQELVQREATHLFRGLLHAIGARLMNPPEHDRRAAWKPFQLQLAHQVGLETPRTLMTDDPSTVRAFVDEVREVVYKPFTGPSWRLVPTRRLTPDALAHLEAVRLAPVIFQERIPCAQDIRVTIVGGEVFAGAAPHAGLGDLEDNRIGPRKPLRPHDLPPAIAAMLRNLMDNLRLVYGAIDMRLTPDGRYVFLEINPAGQYLWVEIETGLPISRAIASWLATGCARITRSGT